MLYHNAPKLYVEPHHVAIARRMKDLAINETHTYDGWNPDGLEQRLMVGYTAEAYMADFLRRRLLVEVEHPEPSGPQGDQYDLRIGRFLIDVKTTCTFDIPPRVNASRTVTTHVDWYIFTRMDVRLRWIQILGVGTREQVSKPENLVASGQLIPGTKKSEFFRHGSYYPRKLDPIETLVGAIKSEL